MGVFGLERRGLELGNFSGVVVLVYVGDETGFGCWEAGKEDG